MTRWIWKEHKHSLNLHVWPGKSRPGATNICMFEGIMDKWLYVDILDHSLKPFIRSDYGDSRHRFVNDNDPKHTSGFATDWLRESDIKW